MNTTWLRVGAVCVALALLALVWWGWHQGGLALMQFGLGAC